MFEHIADFTAWPILTGTFISHLLDISLFGKGYITHFVFCVMGAIVVLWIWKKLFG